MAEENKENDRPLVERWLEEQQEWQKTMLRYMDSMANNEEFLVHLGNAMRGSLLAGKPYPGTAAPQTEGESAPVAEAGPDDDRLDRVLFALHEIQGQLNDLQLTIEGLVAAAGTAVERSPEVDEPAAPADESTDAAPEQGPSEALRRIRTTRKFGSASQPPKLRRPQPRGGFTKRGGDGD